MRADRRGLGDDGGLAGFEFTDPAAEAEIGSLMRLVTEIRQFRSGQGLRPGQRVPARLAGHRGARRSAAHEESIRALLRLTVRARRHGFARQRRRRLRSEGVTVELDLAGTVDVAAERKRLETGTSRRPARRRSR